MNKGKPLERDQFFTHMRRLLRLESEAEAQQMRARMQRVSLEQAEKSGLTLRSLGVTQAYGGLGGRFIVTLARRRQGALPWTTLGVGAPVLLSAEKAGLDLAWRGVVAELLEGQIAVALENMPEDFDDEKVYRLDLASDEVTRQRQEAALAKAAAAKTSSRDERERRLATLRDVLLDQRPPEAEEALALTVFDQGLDASQREAVHQALTAKDVAIIHGPPGTGKTTAVIELIRQAAARGEKILACAPSNLAVDNILERLVQGGAEAVRLGHPARVLETLRPHSLDLMVEEHEDFKLARKLMREAHKLLQQAGRFTRAKPAPGAKQAMRQEARDLLKEARRLEAQATSRILDGAAVICATATALDPKMLGERYFDLAVLDEAGQATEPLSWLLLPWARRLVLAGDHQQLPPTIVSREALAAGFGVSLMERLVTIYGPKITRRLDIQYRMHAEIMGFSSQEFYEASLKAAPAVAGHLLSGLPNVKKEDLTLTAIQFIDTAGAGYSDEIEPGGESHFNHEEAQLALKKARDLIELGVPAADIAIIAPYSAQVRYLRETALDMGVEVNSIDGFQGREKEAVIISCVRSNQEGVIGFLAETRRINVAMTRARRKLMVIGDSATLAVHPFYERLLNYVGDLGMHTTVWDTEF